MFSYLLSRNVANHYSNLEKISNNSKRIKDLFRPKANQIREKIKLECDESLLDDCTLNGKKSLETMWRCCYHSFMQSYKKHKKSMKQDEYNLLVAYFQSGTGHLYSILFKLASDYGDHLAKFVPEFKRDLDFEEDRKRVELHQQVIANQCIHRLLVFLGDLYRYLDHLGQENCRLLATKWYNAAILFDQKIGMPFNQLGSLAGTDNYNLDSVYYHIRCLSCEKPYDNAEANLKHIFNMSKSLMSELSILNNNSECVYLVKKCIVEFIHLINIFWFKTDDLYQLESLIGCTLNTFNQAIQLKSKPTNARKPTYLSPEIVFQLTVILIIINQNFKEKSFQGDKLSTTLNSASIGFVLNYLYYLINVMNKKIKEKNIVEKSSSISNKENKSNGFIKRSSLFKLRRKANVKLSNEDSLYSVLDDEEDDLNELEETALSTIDALEMSSDLSETGSFCDEEESSNSFLTTSDDEDGSQLSQHNLNNSSSNTVSITYEIGRFLAYLYNESILPSIKLLIDWLTINEHLFDTYYQAFDSLFGNFVDLLNILIDLEEKALKSNENLTKFRYTYNWKQDYPLSVDISVMNLDTFKDYHKINLDMDKKINSNLTEEESGFLCIQSILAFGHHITGNLSKYRIEYNHTSNKFILLDKNDIKLNGLTADNQLRQTNDHLFDFGSPTIMKNNFIGNFIADQINNDIIPNVSHLWLDKPIIIRENGYINNNSAPKDLNNSSMGYKVYQNNSGFKSNEQSNKKVFLPYILLDVSAYSENLKLVKELFDSKRYFIVVPKTILKELGKQKNSYNSKEAINWIQSKRSNQSKYLRLLKSEERLHLNDFKYPRKDEKHQFDFHIMLEHCNYLNRKNIAKYNENRDGVNDKVFFVYGKDNCFPVNYEELLDKIGVKFCDLNSFVKKCRLSNDDT